MSDFDYGLCDVCGEPATHAVRDAIENTPDGSKFMTYRTGPLKRGCEEHQAENFRFELFAVGEYSGNSRGLGLALVKIGDSAITLESLLSQVKEDIEDGNYGDAVAIIDNALEAMS